MKIESRVQIRLIEGFVETKETGRKRGERETEREKEKGEKEREIKSKGERREKLKDLPAS